MSIGSLPKSLQRTSPVSPRSPRQRIVYPESAPYTPSPRRHTQRAGQRIEDFLDENLPNAHSYADRLFVYQQAFDLLINEFQHCRSVVESIKRYYDYMATELLNKHRKHVTEEVSESSADEHYNDVVNKLRYAKNHEFADFKAESEKRIDDLTALRIKNIELTKQIESSSNELETLKKENEYRAQQIKGFIARTEQYEEDYNQITQVCSELRQQVDSLQNEIDTVRNSMNILTESSTKTKEENDEMDKEFQANADELAALEQEKKDSLQLISDLKSSNIELDMKNEAMATKLEAQKNRIATLEKQLRDRLNDHNTPLFDLIKLNV